jgi:hypothetical protein
MSPFWWPQIVVSPERYAELRLLGLEGRFSTNPRDGHYIHVVPKREVTEYRLGHGRCPAARVWDAFGPLRLARGAMRKAPMLCVVGLRRLRQYSIENNCYVIGIIPTAYHHLRNHHKASNTWRTVGPDDHVPFVCTALPTHPRVGRLMGVCMHTDPPSPRAGCTVLNTFVV